MIWKLVIVKILMILMLLLPGQVISQETAYKQFLPEQGLLSTTIYKVKRDSRNTLWLSTDKGMCSYDGYHFKAYDSSLYEDYDMLNFVIDERDQIWHFNLSGDLYLISNSKIKAITNYKYDDHPILEMVVNGKILFLIIKVNEKRKLVKYKIENNNLVHISDLKEILDPNYSTFGSRKNSHLYLEISQEITVLYTLDSIKNNLQRLYTFPFASTKVCQVDNFEFVFSHKSKIYFTQESALKSEIDLNKKILSLNYLNDELLVLTEQGLYTLTLKNNILNVQNIQFTSFELFNILEDTEGGLWIGTGKSGLLFIPNNSSTIFNTDNSDLSHNNISTITIDKDKSIYAGLENGDLAIIKDSLYLSEFNFGKHINEITIHKNKLWIASDQKLSEFNLEDFGLNSQVYCAKSIAIIDDENLLLGSYGMAFKSNPHRFFNDATPEDHILSNHRTYAVSADEKGNYYVGSINGLYVYREHGNGQIDTISDHNISDIEIANDSIWFASTFARGLFKIKNNKMIRQYSIDNELSSNRINSLYSTANELFISTDNGLNILNLNTDELFHISTSDGLPSKEINAAITTDGYIWLATSKGLSKIKYSFDQPDNINYEIVENNIAINRRDTVLQNYYELKANQRNIDLKFSTPSFQDADYVNFYYRIGNKDSNWHLMDGNQLRLDQLNYGKTIVNVYASNKNHGLQSDIKKYIFNVYTPVVNRAWFKIVLVGLLLFLLVYLWTRSVKKKHKLEKESLMNQKKIEGFRLTALQNHMNPHFISNSLLAIQDLLDSENRWKASEFTSEFADLVRQSMQMTTAERISLIDEINFLDKYMELEKLRFQNNIETVIQLCDQLELKKNLIFIPPLLIQPIIENSFKHANFSESVNPIIQIILELKDRKIIARILDNGSGFQSNIDTDLDKYKNSTGLNTVRERLELNSKQLGLKSENNPLLQFSQISNNGHNFNQVQLTIHFDNE